MSNLERIKHGIFSDIKGKWRLFGWQSLCYGFESCMLSLEVETGASMLHDSRLRQGKGICINAIMCATHTKMLDQYFIGECLSQSCPLHYHSIACLHAAARLLFLAIPFCRKVGKHREGLPYCRKVT